MKVSTFVNNPNISSVTIDIAENGTATATIFDRSKPYQKRTTKKYKSMEVDVEYKNLENGEYGSHNKKSGFWTSHPNRKTPGYKYINIYYK